MAIYTIGAPDGRKIKIEAPDEATAIRGAQEWTAANPIAPLSDMPPAGAKPGSKEYAVWARDRAIAGHKLPQVSPNPNDRDVQSSILDPFVQGTTFGWADEARGLVQGGLAAMQGKDFGETYRNVVDESRQSLDRERRLNPVGSLAAEIAGAIPTGMGLGGQLAARGSTLGARAISGMVAGAGQGAVYGAGAGAGNMQERAVGAIPSAIVGGAFGAAAPYVGNWIDETIRGWKQGRVLDQAAKAAPRASEIKSMASDLFEQATGGQPLMISDNAYFRFLGGVKASADKLRINPQNDPQAVGLLNTLMSIADDTANNVRPDMKDLHLVRQLAQKVAQSSEGRDQLFGSLVIKSMDDLIASLRPDDILGGTDPRQSANALIGGISAWSRANKVAMVEEAIRKGQAAAAGPEKGIRNTLRAMIFNKPDVWNRFSPAEQRAIKDVIDGTPGSNLMKLIGTFGFGGNTATNGIGGAAGMALGQMAGGPIGMVAGPVIGSIGRNASEKMTANLANRALGAVATKGLRVIPPANVADPSLVERAIRLGLPSFAAVPANR